MKTMYAADDKVIVFLQGLRWVSKRDTSYGYYELEIAYKGVTKIINYTSESARDTMYYRIQASLQPNAARLGDDDEETVPG